MGIVRATCAQALARRQSYVTPGGAQTWVSTYIGTNKMELLARGGAGPTAAGGPMAYLVEQATGSTVAPHFHEVEQFQLFIGGGGRIGTHPLAAVTVHYAGPHSPYGPIAADAQGVQYVTLRRRWDPGAQWMPDSAPKLRAMGQRQHVAWTSEPVAGLDETCAPGAVAATDLTPAPAAQQPGGERARVVRAGAGASLDAVLGVPGWRAHDRYWWLLQGQLLDAQGSMAPRDCTWLPAGALPADLRAGPEGVALVEVRFAGAR